MAATQRTIDFDALATMTADAYYKAGIIHDGIFKSNPTFIELKKKGIRQDGGVKIKVDHMYGKNSTVDSYDRYGLLDTAPQDGFTPSFYDWCQYAGTVSVDGLTKAQNSGKPQIQKLMREKVKQLTMSFAERMNNDLWDVETNTTATGNGGKNIIPITHFVQDDPSNDLIDVGGINQSAEEWWQNQFKNSADSAITYSALRKEMVKLYNDCGKGGGGAPDILIASQDVFEFYEASMDAKIQYRMDDKATIGFENIKFKNAKMFWDEHIPDPLTLYNWDHASYAPTTQGAVYMLNSKTIDLVTMPGKDFAPTGFSSPTNQDASVGKWVFYGQLVCNNRRKNGVHFDITSTASA